MPTPYEIAIRRKVQLARLVYAKANRAGDILGAISSAKSVDRHERELAKYLGLEADAPVA